MPYPQPKIIFILGHARSGTTLLNKVLSAHPAVNFISNQFNELSWFYSHQFLYDGFGDKKYWLMAQDFFGYPGIKKIDSANSKPPTSIKDFSSWFSWVLDQYRQDKKFVGVKISGGFSENIAFIKKMCPEAYYLQIIRDPRDVFLSLRKMPLGVLSPFYAGKSWQEAVSQAQELKSQKHYYEIKYESLITSPKAELEKVCVWLGLDFDEKMLSFYRQVKAVKSFHKLLQQDFVKDNFNKWPTRLSQAKLNLIYAGAGSKICQLGYLNYEPKAEISFFSRISEFLLDRSYFYFQLVKTGWILNFKDWRYKLKIRLRYWFNFKYAFQRSIFVLFRKMKTAKSLFLDFLKENRWLFWQSNLEKIEIEITTDCNLKCLNCDRSARQAPSSEAMTVEQIEKFVAESINLKWHWKNIRIMGGEPTLHPQLQLILAAINQYRSFCPEVMVEIVSNGFGGETNSILKNLPEWVAVKNTGKLSAQQPHTSYNVAPVDLEKYQTANFKQGCSITEKCGLGLSRYGYYPCGAGAGLDRVFGFAVSIKTLAEVNPRSLQRQKLQLCRYCGHFKNKSLLKQKVTFEEEVSPSWQQAYSQYKIKKPELPLY
ncbi:MAG: sulfotransferase [Patescibacteria group bacterium]|jgi:sulfatase maturation enzyme AslB (radical SAM superfamily)